MRAKAVRPSDDGASVQLGEAKQHAIQLLNVAKTYALGRQSGVAAVRGVSLDLSRGEFVVITGRSGSGKTTLLNLAAGLTRPSSGRVLVGGTDLWCVGDAQRARLRNRQIGFVFQFPSLLPSLTATENVVLPSLFGPRRDQGEVNKRAVELLAAVGLSEKLGSYPRQLSKGQQQRVVIARSLTNRPDILIADEATSDLDEQTEGEIMELFREIHRGTGVTILMVTHAAQLTAYGTRSLKMVDGTIVG